MRSRSCGRCGKATISAALASVSVKVMVDALIASVSAWLTKD
jgi:hypothetical protein